MLEGVDKTGKSTLLKAINRATNYKHFCIDRCLGSAFVYDYISNRRNRNKKLKTIEKDFSQIKSIPIITILLTCKKQVLIDRIRKEDESPNQRIKLLDKALKAYKMYKKYTYLPLIEVDTTNKSVSQTVNEILQKIKEYEK